MTRDTPLTRLLRSTCTPNRARKLLLRNGHDIGESTLEKWWYNGNIPGGQHMLALADALDVDLRKLCYIAQESA